MKAVLETIMGGQCAKWVSEEEESANESECQSRIEVGAHHTTSCLTVFSEDKLIEFVTTILANLSLIIHSLTVRTASRYDYRL